ncbi:hypothetical protein [Pedobacter endophyticus]|uniref:STAS domain-containing protein n=1 Tax=Pedobacter endophyticus TaxID=2789740 RepID=A0A7S9PZY5_9SPHI|nr:hypothetical protein [Pedobacter endophyticus]QPH40385.1 hypothetical protein IZT61_03645 [Pedobacter endophyticus]
MNNEVTIYLGQDRIYTDATGIRQILRFYYECKVYQNYTININLDNIEWIDGNLCAFLGALMYRLSIENKLAFLMDSKQVSAKCNILFANDFLPITQNENHYKIKSCLPFRGFLPKQKDEFYNYLENDLFAHNAMPKLLPEVQEQLIDYLGEVYGNIDKHAETELPFFVCGQYYPSKNALHFTISDLGVGFFKKINAQKPINVKSCGDAILWAIAGNSTKQDAPGGSGLRNLNAYLRDNNGAMQIYTGDAGWCSKTVNSVLYPDGISLLRNNYLGATINLEFNTKNLNFRNV